MTRIRNVVAVAGMVAGVFAGYLLVAHTERGAVTSPVVEQTTVTVDLTCPEEDSCTPHYDGATNSWTVTRP
jgi:hypothetical protein